MLNLVILETRLLVSEKMGTFRTHLHKQSSCSGVPFNNEHFLIMLYSGEGKEGDPLFLYKYSYLSGHNLNLSKVESCHYRALKNFNNLLILV